MTAASSPYISATHAAQVRIIYTSAGSTIVPLWQIESWKNEYRAIMMRARWLESVLEQVKS